jgi:hypothetical protein
MTAMCSTVDDSLVGWATARTDCDGNVTIEYFDTNGVSQGGTLPANWGVCQPS